MTITRNANSFALLRSDDMTQQGSQADKYRAWGNTLRGNRYRGAWEYEVTSGGRVFYVPDEENRKVLVY